MTQPKFSGPIPCDPGYWNTEGNRMIRPHFVTITIDTTRPQLRDGDGGETLNRDMVKGILSIIADDITCTKDVRGVVKLSGVVVAGWEIEEPKV